MRRRDKHRSIAARRRRILELRQPLGQNVAHLVETDRPDRRHRIQFAKRRLDLVAIANRRRGDRADPRYPFTPQRALRQRRKYRDMRERGLPQMPQVGDLVLERRGLRGVVVEFGAPPRQLALQSVQPPRPALSATDHGRIDDYLLPSSRRARAVFSHRRLRRGCRITQIAAERAREQLTIERDLARRFSLRAAGYLRERKVFGIAAGRKILGRAGKQREQRTPSRTRTPGAKRKIGGDIGAIECLLQARQVAHRVMQENRDSIEAHARASLVIDSPRNLDALVHLARR